MYCKIPVNWRSSCNLVHVRSRDLRDLSEYAKTYDEIIEMIQQSQGHFILKIVTLKIL